MTPTKRVAQQPRWPALHRAVVRAERLLRLNPGDLRRGVPLFACLFLIILSSVGGKATRDALFLGQFRPARLAYGDIVGTVIVALFLALYFRVRQRVGFCSLVCGTLFAFGACTLAFWVLALFYPRPLVAVIYVWVGVLAVVGPVQVWTLANYVLTVREAKRLYAFIASGAILGAIFGSLGSGLTTKAFGAEAWLLAMAPALAIASVLARVAWGERVANGASALHERAEDDPDNRRNVRDSFRLVASSRYLRAIAILVCCASFVTYIAAWQFKAIAKAHIPNTNDLAFFFNAFNFCAGILSFVVQLLLASAVLRRFGIGVALFVVPVALLAGSTGLLVGGGLAAVIFLRSGDQVLRYSIDKPSVELLYLPVPASQTFHAKSFIDTMVSRAGDGLASVTVLVLAGLLHLAAPKLSWVVVVMIGGWMAAAFVARRYYVTNLADTIRRHRLDAERASARVLDRHTTQLIVSYLKGADAQQAVYALKLLEIGDRPASHPAVRELLEHSSADVRARAIATLAAAGDESVMPVVERLLHDEHADVRSEALLYLTRLRHIDPLEWLDDPDQVADFSVRSAIVSYCARPGERQNLEAATVLLDAMVAEQGPAGRRTRLEAARLIGSLPNVFGRQLWSLVDDLDEDVARTAIRSAGRLKAKPLTDRLITALGDEVLTEAASEALVEFGDDAVEHLRQRLADSRASLAVRREIPKVLLNIGSQEAADALAENLLAPDTTLRFRTISSLNKLARRHPNRRIDTMNVEILLAAEIVGHYRSYQILGSLTTMAGAIRESMDRELERIFRLLQLLAPQQDLHSAYVGVRSIDPVVHDSAIELLENILQPALCRLLLPLIDTEVATDERVRIAQQVLGTTLQSHEEAIRALIHSKDPWLKACGAHAIGIFGVKSLEPHLDRWVENADPLLRDTARYAKIALASAAST